MIGIYKITNNINNHCYIGQSIHIEKRWQEHKLQYNWEREKDKPLYMRERFNYNLNGAGQAWLQFSVNINNPNSNASTVSSLFYYIYSCNIY